MKVFWFDTETGGLNAHKHALLQLAYILEIDGRIEEKKVLYANGSAKEIDDCALEVTGFTRDQISKWPSPTLMYKHLISLFDKHIDKYDKEDKMIVGGYNVAFDVDFLRQLFYEHGNSYLMSYLAYGYLDPAVLFRTLQWRGILDDEHPLIRLTLSSLADYIGLSVESAHDALADIILTRTVTEELYSMLSGGLYGD